ncbi:MAG: antibiotic biosynthesis monooxygenase [Deltaproteobacteria bacterium]|nr:antibiotic biosynthesis monooxygenase [Deltaproteobacteria bacterium]
MIVVTNRIAVSRGFEQDFEERFRRRAGLVDQNPGFIRNEIHRPKPLAFDRQSGSWQPKEDADARYLVMTWWRSLDDFVAWTKSESFRKAHADPPPKEMFSAAAVLEIHEVFQQSGGDPNA